MTFVNCEKQLKLFDSIELFEEVLWHFYDIVLEFTHDTVLLALCAGDPLNSGGFPAQKTSNVKLSWLSCFPEQGFCKQQLVKWCIPDFMWHHYNDLMGLWM